jgi:hypothetical protein
MWMGWDEMDDMDVTVARRELPLGNSHTATDTTLVVAIHLIPSNPMDEMDVIRRIQLGVDEHG